MTGAIFPVGSENLHHKFGTMNRKVAQLVNYLKATGIEVSLLINFVEFVQVKRKVFTPPN